MRQFCRVTDSGTVLDVFLVDMTLLTASTPPASAVSACERPVWDCLEHGSVSENLLLIAY